MKIEDRLTFRNQFGVVSRRGYEISISRLAAYEDSGLSPSEVEAMKEKQIPKPPKPETMDEETGVIEEPECQICGALTAIEMQTYCYKCGQRLK